MPRLHIRTINHEFDVTDEGRDYPDLAKARGLAIKAGAAISADEIAGGKTSSIIEIRIVLAGKVIDRLAIASTMSPLKLAGESSD